MLKIERKATDNKYLHRDFFVSGDIGISYVGENFGDNAVIEYFTDYAQSYYKLLAEEVKNDGLIKLKEYFVKIYTAEEWLQYFDCKLTENSLKIKVVKCPAITFMKNNGHTPSKWYKETVYTVYGVLAKMCGYSFKVYNYDEETGKTEFEFIK